MNCIAITRGGFGSVLLFESAEEAFLHPVVQYGDAIVPSAEDLPELYNKTEWVRLMRLAGVDDRLAEDALVYLSPLEERSLRRRMSEKIWTRLTERAIPPPSDIETIQDMISRDRSEVDRRTGVSVQTATDAAPKPITKKAQKEAERAERAAAKAAAPAAPAKSEPKPDTGDFNPATKIRFGKDKEGKSYSATHMPYRADSNRAGRWATLKNGITVKKVVEAGLRPRHLADMVERGFITLEVPAESASAESSEADETEAETEADESSEAEAETEA